MSSEDSTFLDGNAAAGDLREVFAFDITAAVGRCGGCGRTAPLADTRLYARALGLVVRCVQCDRVLVRLVCGPRHTRLDLSGLTYLEFQTRR